MAGAQLDGHQDGVTSLLAGLYLSNCVAERGVRGKIRSSRHYVIALRKFVAMIEM
jgi:hypothetical protein